MKRTIISWLMAAVLLAVALANWGCSKNPMDSGAKYNGAWSGTTSQGKAISFTVTNNAVASLRMEYFMQGDYCAFDALSTSTFSSPQQINGNRISISHTGTSSYLFTGTFNSKTSASGSLELSYTSYFPTCSGKTTVTWTASK